MSRSGVRSSIDAHQVISHAILQSNLFIMFAAEKAKEIMIEIPGAKAYDLDQHRSERAYGKPAVGKREGKRDDDARVQPLPTSASIAVSCFVSTGLTK